jgi:hypothetical protein
VEGADPRLGVAVRDQLVDALRHLARRLVGEGEGEDLLGTRLLAGDEVGDAAGEDGGLAGARAGHDEQRPAPWVTASSWAGERPSRTRSYDVSAGAAMEG